MNRILKTIISNYSLMGAFLLSVFGLFCQYDYTSFYKSQGYANVGLAYQSFLIFTGIPLYFLAVKIFSDYRKYGDALFRTAVVLSLTGIVTIFFMAAHRYRVIIVSGNHIDDMMIGSLISAAILYAYIHYSIKNADKPAGLNDYFVIFIMLYTAFFDLKYTLLFYGILIIIRLLNRQTFRIPWGVASLALLLAFCLAKRELEYVFSAMKPNSQPGTDGYDLYYAMHDVGRGGLMGVWQKYSSLPDITNDMMVNTKQLLITQVIAYKYGVIGVLTVCSFLLAVLWRYFNKRITGNPFGIFAVFYLLLTFFLSVAAGFNLLPHIFLYQLPFIGYGITAVLIPYFLLGILKGIDQQNTLAGEGYDD